MNAEVEALKLAFSTNTNWAEWAAFAVFIGLLFDIAVILIFDLFDPDKSWWEIGLAGVASAVIAAGVWGESHFGHRASAAASQVQSILQNETAEANARANEAEKETLQLAQQFKPRYLSFPEKESDAVAKRLEPFAKQAIDVFWLGGDPDAAILGTRIAGALIHAGWSVSLFPNAVTILPTSGIIIDVETPSDVSSVKAAEALYLALKPYDFKPQMPPVPLLRKMLVSYTSFGTSKNDAPLWMLVGTK